MYYDIKIFINLSINLYVCCSYLKFISLIVALIDACARKQLFINFT